MFRSLIKRLFLHLILLQHLFRCTPHFPQNKQLMPIQYSINHLIINQSYWHTQQWQYLNVQIPWHRLSIILEQLKTLY